MFKWLLVIAVVVLGYVWWRHQRQISQRARAMRDRSIPTPPHTSTPTAMVRCRHCGVHVPVGDAVRGALGTYCSHEHRRLAEG
jgi:uncharacterized protein